MTLALEEEEHRDVETSVQCNFLHEIGKAQAEHGRN